MHKEMPKQHKYKQKPRRPEYSPGDVVYFHAYAGQKDDNAYFLCKGIVTRGPLPDNPTYKLIVTAVDPKSVLCGEQPEFAQPLIGKRIVRQENQLRGEIGGLLSKMYEGHGWIEMDPQAAKECLEKIKRNHHERKQPDSRPNVGDGRSNVRRAPQKSKKRNKGKKGSPDNRLSAPQVEAASR